jgi:hypothetical protein
MASEKVLSWHNCVNKNKDLRRNDRYFSDKRLSSKKLSTIRRGFLTGCLPEKEARGAKFIVVLTIYTQKGSPLIPPG